MKLPKLDSGGQAAAVNMQLTLIISLVVAIIIVYQLVIAGVGPTAYAYLDDNGNPSDNSQNWDNVDNHDEGLVAAPENPDYDAEALNAYNNTIAIAWAGIGLMAVAIIILAASVILGVVRGFGGSPV
jgi:hypothetical protein